METTETYESFDQEEIQATLEAVHSQYNTDALMASAISADQPIATENAELEIAAASCISVTVQNGRICLKLPLGIGQVCVPVPAFVPSGSVAQACLKIKTFWGIPRGVRVTVHVGGQEIISQYWGI